MGNCNIGSYIDKSIIIPQHLDEVTTQTDLNQIDKSEMATFQIPFETYVLTAYTNMIPTFLQFTNIYKKQKYDQIVKTMKKIKIVPYEDECFNIKNFINNVIHYIDENVQEDKMINQYDIKKLKKYKMIRLSTLFEANSDKDMLKRFSLDRERMRIKKTSYGNPNLINGALFLQLNDNLWIKNLLHKIDYENKIFVIRLFIQGLPKQIVIDEHVPVDENNDHAFLSPINNNYWFLFIEKAIAKVNRSYANSLRCYVSELFPLLTEAPMLKYKHNMISPKNLWKKIKEATQQNLISFSENHQKSPRSNPHLVFLSFFLSSIFKVNSTKYIELIIPEHGSEKNLLLDLKKTIHVESNDISNKKFFPEGKLASDNILFMKFDYFYSFFNQTHILKKDNQYIHTSKKLEMQSNQYTMLKIKTLQKTKVIITLYFKESRYSSQEVTIPICRAILAQLIIEEKYMKKKNNSSYQNDLDLNTILSESKGSFFEEENEYLWKYIHSVYGRDNQLSIEAELDSGIYYVLVKLGSNDPISTVVSLYSSTFVEFSNDFDEEIEGRVIQPQNLTKLVTALKSLYYSFLEKNKKITNIENDPELHLVQSINNNNFGAEVFKIENCSSSKLLTITLKYESKGLLLIKHKVNGKIHETQKEINEEEKEFRATLAPNSSELLIFEYETEDMIEHTINCIIEKPKHFDAKEFLTMKRLRLNDDVFYQEVPYGKGVLIIIVNQSDTEYFLHTVFDKLENLNIENSVNDKEIDMFLKPFSKNFINLIMIENDTVVYQMNFTIKQNALLIKQNI